MEREREVESKWLTSEFALKKKTCLTSRFTFLKREKLEFGSHIYNLFLSNLKSFIYFVINNNLSIAS